MNNPMLHSGEAATFDDPLATLAACHLRIRKQLATLARLERHLPEHGHDADARAAARSILRYFDSAMLRHHEDEEASLLPRLVVRAPENRALADRLKREHGELDALWRKLRPLLAGIASGQRAVMPPRLVRELTAAYFAHIEFEESEVFPVARRSLSRDEFAMIGREMADRRGVAIEA